MPTQDLTTAKIQKALEDFCLNFATPPLADAMHVVLGFTNQRTLPSDGNDFCIVTPITQRRAGTTIEHWEKQGPGTIELREYVELDVQLDCFSSSIYEDHARQRAQTYETVCRSSVGVQHFREYDIDCLYSEGCTNLSAVIDSAQYVSRWMVMLHLGYWKRVSVSEDFFSAVDLRLINVDSHFKP